MNRYWVVKDVYGWRLHFIERNGETFLGDRDGEGGWFTLFDDLTGAYSAIESSRKHYGAQSTTIGIDEWTVEEFEG